MISAFEDSERPGEFHLASMISDSSRHIELNEEENVPVDEELGPTGAVDETNP
jgi:hypothetical protein